MRKFYFRPSSRHHSSSDARSELNPPSDTAPEYDNLRPPNYQADPSTPRQSHHRAPLHELEARLCDCLYQGGQLQLRVRLRQIENPDDHRCRLRRLRKQHDRHRLNNAALLHGHGPGSKEK